MAKKSFDLGDSLAAVLGSVSESDRGQREQIEYIDIVNLDADKENFYSIDGIDELAANIELIGLQQPLRVRPNPDMPGRYLIVSGHRRRAALWTLYEEEPEKWGKVPCIVEQPAESPEMQELRLIYANAATRQMSSADLSKQAERVEMLLYQLKKRGVEFPGRMRDHVAAACKVSATKLAVLKVIREKLIPDWKKLWEKGKLAESSAYKIAQQPDEIQKKIRQLSKDPEYIQEWKIEDLTKHIKKARKCKLKGGECLHGEAMLKVQHLESGYHQCSSYECCSSCYSFDDCKFVCPFLKAKQEEKRKQKKANRKNELAKEKARDAVIIDRAKLCWKRFGEMRTARNLSQRDCIEARGDTYFSWHDDKGDRERETGEAKFTPSTKMPFAYIDGADVIKITKMADFFECSTDYLLGRTEDPSPAAAPQASGLISVDDRYPDEGTFVIAVTKNNVAIPAVYFRASFMDFTERSIANNRINGVEWWAPLPPLPNGDKWMGQETLEGMIRRSDK